MSTFLVNNFCTYCLNLERNPWSLKMLCFNSVLFLTYLIILLVFPIFAVLPNTDLSGEDGNPCLSINLFSNIFFNFRDFGGRLAV